YLEFQKCLGDSADKNAINQAYQNESISTYNISFADKYLPGTLAETYTASLIYFGCRQKKFEKEWLGLFDRFKEKYPESMAIPYLEPWVKPIKDYYESVKADFTEQMKFVDNTDQINTLEQCLAKMKGKKLYVDVWATWCIPCKDEFKHNESLKAYLKPKGFEVLYISIDHEEKDRQWREMIKYYNLEGYHIRASEEFASDLRKILGDNGALGVPHYLLVDEYGKIIDKNAARPSSAKVIEIKLDKLGY
ncbi:MAG: TlpA disulfide reductase family protein, partial [Bacteroidota bacterium]